MHASIGYLGTGTLGGAHRGAIRRGRGGCDGRVPRKELAYCVYKLIAPRFISRMRPENVGDRNKVEETGNGMLACIARWL